MTTLDRVLLDASACIYYLDRPSDDARRQLVAPVVRAAEAGKIDLVISAVTVTELLVAPLRNHDTRSEAAVRLFTGALCRVSPASAAIADRAARLRAHHHLATPDALVYATGLIEGAEAIVGNDARWKRVADGRYLHLDDLLRNEVDGEPAAG